MNRLRERWSGYAASLLGLRPFTKRVIVTLADAAGLVAAGLILSALCLKTWLLPPVVLTDIVALSAVYTLICFSLFGVYNVVVHLWNASQLARIGVAVVVATLALLGTLMATGQFDVLWNLAILQGGSAFLVAISVRAQALVLLRPGLSTGKPAPRVVIYGAGRAGSQLAAALAHSGELTPVAFMDDDPSKQGRVVHGLKVYSPDRLNPRLKRLGVNSILLALPSATRARRTEIMHGMQDLHVKVLLVPGLDEIARGMRRIDELREVQVEDLLGRDPVAPDEQLMDAFIRDQVVMVTGAGGSIGSELCRQVLERKLTKLVLFELSELALYNIERELRAVQQRSNDRLGRVEIVPVLGSVLDRELMTSIIERHGVQTIYHAAAYKHVPLVEANVLVGIRNNVYGTRVTVQAAADAGVQHFVLVSTDKAVRPTSVMGATKRVAELVVQAQAERCPDMQISIVRFGNVLASSGSVVPLFQEQLAGGGPITVTHPDVTRYFMTIPEAAQLVIQAGAMGRHGEVFLLEMGQPVRIVDLARRLINLTGLHVQDQSNPSGDIRIEFSGLRPGEKLFEELLIGPASAPTNHPRIFKAEERGMSPLRLERELVALEATLTRHGVVEPAVDIVHRLANFSETDSRQQVGREDRRTASTSVGLARGLGATALGEAQVSAT